MLTPDELSKYASELVQLFEELESFVIYDVSRGIQKQFERYGEIGLTSTAVYQIQALEEMGVSMKEIKKKIAAAERISIQSATKLFGDANVKSFEREKRIFELAGKKLVMSSSKLQIIENGIKNIERDFLDFTKSMGMAGLPLERAYHRALNTAYLETASGARDYNSAIKEQIKILAKEGLQYINYSTKYKGGEPRKDRLDVAVRRAVITGLKDTTNRVSEINAAEMGCDGYEISAHTGARPTHQRWQGRQYAIRETQGYELYSEVVGDQMEEPNCRHTKWGVFLGVTRPMLTERMIKDLDRAPFKFSVNGKEYDSWAASQKQRSIERAIRQTKREITGYKGAGLKDEENSAKAYLKCQLSLYKRFSKEAGLPEQKERLGVII